MELTQSVKLSTNDDTKGYDVHAGKTWIYPINYAVREYQFNIIQKALFENTLVSLPTGLGKTFIAAVVMYNFYRWFPNGKVIFMAPTRPLVKQQIDACYSIVAIPKEVTIELTGSKQQNSRSNLWKDKRVFFITPQILQNDLSIEKDLGKSIKCLVFDEAHKARGNYAYCDVIKKLVTQNKYFRVLALSATPGSNVPDVLDVIKNLLISHVEFKNEESLDVKPYVFQRTLETVVVPLSGELEHVKEEYLKILEKYSRCLITYKIINGNFSTLTKGRIFMTMKEVQFRNQSHKHPNFNEIMKSLKICVTLYHGYEVLIRHGLRGFLSFFDQHIENPLLRGNMSLVKIMEDIRQYLGPTPNVELLPDGTYMDVSKDTKFGHPKYYKLQEILLFHFSEEANKNGRVIVFFEYRDSVMEAYMLLLQSRPTIRPRIFIGQGSGITQRVQINVVKAFREGQCNTLLSTSIGEEGLDVGDVDLIICFDISNKSPIRMVQRMGRTGRKREGRVYILVTEGKEQQTLKECLIHKQFLATDLMNFPELHKSYYDCPKLIPAGIEPKCEKIYISVQKPQLAKNSNLKDLFRSISSNTSDSLFISQDNCEFKPITIEKIPGAVNYWNKVNPLALKEDETKLSFSKHLEKQRALQPFHQIGHSKCSEDLTSLLKMADSKRYNLPVTQKSLTSQNKNLKQKDIRNMFLNAGLSDDFAPLTQGVQKSTQIEPETPSNDCAILSELYTEISSCLYFYETFENACKICNANCKCVTELIPNEKINLNNCVVPNFSIFSNIKVEDLHSFLETSKSSSNTLEVEKIKQSELETETNLEEIAFNETIFGDTVFELNTYAAPKNLNEILKKCSNSSTENVCKNVEITSNTPDFLLEYFKLESLEDLFSDVANSANSDSTIIYDFETNLNDSPEKKSPVLSRKILVHSSKNTSTPSRMKIDEMDSDGSESPVLCTYQRMQNLKLKAAKIKNRKQSESETVLQEKIQFSPETISLFEDKINNSSSVICNNNNNNKIENSSENIQALDVEDIFDLSSFLEDNKSPQHKTASPVKSLELEDIFDISEFGLTTTQDKTVSDEQRIKTAKLCNSDSEDMFESSQPESHKIVEENIILSSDSEDKFPNRDQKLIAKKTASQLSITQMISLINTQNASKKPAQTGMVNTVNRPKSGSVFTQKLTNGLKSNKENISNVECNNAYKKETLNGTKTSCESLSLSLLKNSKIKSPSVIDFGSKSNKKLDKANRVDVTINLDSEDDFEEVRNVKDSLPRKKRKICNEFIEEEAEMSSDEEVQVSGDETEQSLDAYDSSFVEDESVINNTQVHMNYLQSIRSPARGTFKIPVLPARNMTNIFSQQVDNVNDTYMQDSFCVNTMEITNEESGSENDLSELELLELKIKEMKRRKKRKKSESKRKRICVISDDSDSS